MNCHACGASLAATARFCHKCGAQVGGAQSSGWRAGLPWSVAGAALGALLTVVALRLGAGSREQGAGDAAEATERTRQRPEYGEHAANLDAFHQQATRGG